MYESLNAIWKEHKVLGRIDLETTKELMELLKGVFDSVPVESVKGYEAEVFELAFKEGLMVYDAAYLFMAMRNGLTLVSDDERLLSKAIRYVKALRTASVL
jgi:predicted nucleic acid-binding protein